MTAETDLADGIIRHALELQRLSIHEEAQAEATLRELEADLRTLLNSRNLSTASRREIAAIIRQADDAINAKYINIAGILDTDGIAEHVADRTVNLLTELYPSVKFTLPTQETLRALTTDILIYGSPASEWWAKQAEETAFKFAGVVRRGVINGYTNEQIVRQVVGGRGEVGILDIARRHARALVHSSIMTAANQARLETYRKNFKDKGGPGLKWLATLDTHTCPTCAALDGETWDWDGKPINGATLDFQVPPAHWNCRCLIQPLPPSTGNARADELLAGLGQRVSATGPQKRGTTFREWLSRQSQDTVEDVVGVKRAEMFKAGKITLTDLVTKSGMPLTLEELRAR